MHTLLFSRSLDPDSTQLVLYERSGDGGFVAVKCAALPLVVGVVRMLCHAVNIRLKGKLNTAVIARCLRLLHRVAYHCIHGPLPASEHAGFTFDSPTAAAAATTTSSSSGSGDGAPAKAIAIDWVALVRCLLALCKRLCAEFAKAVVTPGKHSSAVLSDDMKELVAEVRVFVHVCLALA